jgi:hypothetical protein
MEYVSNVRPTFPVNVTDLDVMLCRGEQIMKLGIMQCPGSCTMFSCPPVPNHSLFPFLDARDQVPHPNTNAFKPTQRDATVATVLTGILHVLGSNLCRDIDYPD